MCLPSPPNCFVNLPPMKLSRRRRSPPLRSFLHFPQSDKNKLPNLASDGELFQLSDPLVDNIYGEDDEKGARYTWHYTSQNPNLNGDGTYVAALMNYKLYDDDFSRDSATPPPSLLSNRTLQIMISHSFLRSFATMWTVWRHCFYCIPVQSATGASPVVRLPQAVVDGSIWEPEAIFQLRLIANATPSHR